MPRRSVSEVAGSRAETVGAAVDLASVVGLEGLTIGRLADRLGMSKSGLVGRFGSKEQLQLATLRQAAEIFRRVVYEPAAGKSPGLARLDAICDAWVAYLGRPPFPGGCFLTTAMVEFDARPGPIHDAVSKVMGRWLNVLEREARTAIENGELPAHADPRDIAFTINALAVGANCDFQLNHDPQSLRRVRRAMRAALGAGVQSRTPAGSQRVVSDVTLDWSSAAVKEGRLEVRLRGKPGSGWVEGFERTLALLPGGDWGEVELKKDRVRVGDVPKGSEDRLRHFLESVVLQASSSDRDSDEAPEAEQPTEPQGDDAEMTERFRSFAS